MTKCRNAGQKPWGFRRRLVVITLSFCAGVIGYITMQGHDSEVIGASIVGGAFTLSTAVIGSYIFGAVWNDKGNDKDV